METVLLFHTADNMGESLQTMDLAILGFDELRDLAKKHAVATNCTTRADFIRALRDGGVRQVRQMILGKL